MTSCVSSASDQNTHLMCLQFVSLWSGHYFQQNARLLTLKNIARPVENVQVCTESVLFSGVRVFSNIYIERMRIVNANPLSTSVALVSVAIKCRERNWRTTRGDPVTVLLCALEIG